MKVIVFPESWNALELVPSARSELLFCVRNIARWNDEISPVRIRGADDLIGFLFDVFRLDEGADPWIGKLIFEEEAEPLQQFVNSFDAFVHEWQLNDRFLEQLSGAVLPDEVVERARRLETVLKRRGVPEYR